MRAVDPRLDFALELERRDAVIAERVELLSRLAGEIDRIRERAAELAAFFDRLPAAREHAGSAETEAAAALERARSAVLEAEQEGVDVQAAVRVAEERLERTAALRAALERAAEAAHSEARALAQAAAEAARELGAAPRVTLAAAPGDGLADVLDWAARAHAAILVARSGLDAERDRIFREANELGSSVLGEPLQSTNVSRVRRRVEERLSGAT